MILSSFITAFRTLTIIPLPGKECSEYSNSLLFFPAVGVVLGLISYAVTKALLPDLSAQPLLIGLVITIIGVIITGGLHVDGLADVADGFGGGKNRDQTLSIMKDPCHGTFGVIAILFIILTRVFTASVFIQNSHIVYLLLSPVVGRIVQAMGCTLLPYARVRDGKAISYITPNRAVTIEMALIFLSGITLTAVLHDFSLLWAIVISFSAATLFYLYCFKRIAGITGDCLGAASEIAEATFLLTGIVFLQKLYY